MATGLARNAVAFEAVGSEAEHPGGMLFVRRDYAPDELPGNHDLEARILQRREPNARAVMSFEQGSRESEAARILGRLDDLFPVLLMTCDGSAFLQDVE